MKVSLNIYPGRSIDEIIKISKFLDKNGWHAVYVSDHFMPHNLHVVNGRMVECWTTLAAIGNSTENIQISSFVSPLSFRHPGSLAKAAITVDEISKGRLILGIGAGWQENEHESYGFDLLSPKNRVDRFEEGIQCVKGLLSNDKFSFSGQYFNFIDAECEPKYYDRKIPIMAGCWKGNKRMMNIAYKHADIINVIGTSRDVGKNLNHMNKIYKNVSSPILVKNKVAQDILIKNKHRSLGHHYLIYSEDSLRYELLTYKNLGFEEIILADVSFVSDLEDFLYLIQNIKETIDLIVE